MADIAPGREFPSMSLPDLEGRLRPLGEAWSRGFALIAIGHSDCRTSGLTLPYVDRIHRRRGARAEVLVVLQDDPAAALEAVSGLDVPVRLEADPYPLARALKLQTVPTLVLVDASGAVLGVSEGFRRADLEAFAERLGVAGPLFSVEDDAPALRPG